MSAAAAGHAPRLRFPHPLFLLVLCALVAATLTWVLPAGEYERRQDPVAARAVVVAGTYHRVPASPVGAFQAVVAIPKGMSDAASVIFYVFLVGGAFAVVERTGALAQLVNRLARGLSGRGIWVIPIVGFAFVWGGILIQMQEELIAFVPVLLLLTRRLGFNALTAVAMSLGARRSRLVQPDQPVPGRHRAEGGRTEAAQRLGVPLRVPRRGVGHLDRGDGALRTPHAGRARGRRRRGRGYRARRLAPAGDSRHRARHFRALRHGRDSIPVGFRAAGGPVLPHGNRGRRDRPPGRGRHGGRLCGGLPLDGVRGAADRLRPRDLRGAGRRPRRGHDRPRPVYADRRTPHHALGAGNDGRSRSGASPRAEHERAGGADDAAADPALGSDRPARGR